MEGEKARGSVWACCVSVCTSCRPTNFEDDLSSSQLSRRGELTVLNSSSKSNPARKAVEGKTLQRTNDVENLEKGAVREDCVDGEHTFRRFNSRMGQIFIHKKWI